MDLKNLQDHREDILKAETGALLFNLGKTHVGINNWKKYFHKEKQEFRSYKDYYKFFKKELSEIDGNFEKFFYENIKLPDSSKVNWIEIFKGNFKNIFFRGCENINSGIDKGFPKEKLTSLWISSAYGSFVEDVKKLNFDNKRICFFRDLYYYLKKENPNWKEIRNWILENLKEWYVHLLSDNRFPVNDVTLFDQVYMTASLFKATLAGLYLYNGKVKAYTDKPRNIKWSILGIQYDKLGLSEKALKVANIKWYREKIKELDNKIKKLLEIEYPIGNEVYRDETGIYFVVLEFLVGNKENEFYRLNEDLKEIENKIIKKFSEAFDNEIYPAVFLTEPSRGLMNLGQLVEKAPENFLKAKLNYENENKNDSKKRIGICQICGVRVVEKKDKSGELICNTCLKRQEGRIDNWINNRTEETIWLDELQDKNGRIALVTLKFELGKWINGNMLNSLFTRIEDQVEYEKIIKSILDLIKRETNKGEVRKIQLEQFEEKNITKFLSLFDENGIKKPYEQIFKVLKENKSIDNVENKYKYIVESLIKEKEFLEDFLFYDKSTNKIIGNKKKEKIYSIEDYYKQGNIKDYLYKIFAITYLVFQIKNLILERSIGSEWENFILRNLSKDVIDFEKRKINWKDLNESDNKFLSKIILQLLLRKNPSPARLRRVWETTEEFFKSLEKNILNLLEVPDDRCKRWYWENVKNIKDGEYVDGDLLFWVRNNNVYLISSIEKVFNKNSFLLKNINDPNKTIRLLDKDKKEEKYKPYFTILSPTPISWQFIIPAEYIPNLIENVKKEYYKNFKWVYGKLPLHIGIVVQNYKKPLYVGLKALRRIRRDSQDWQDLKKRICAKEFKNRQKEAFCCRVIEENNNEKFYSLFERADETQKGYEFYLYPETGSRVWIDTVRNSNDNDMFWFYPNTFDFEFLDTNSRRNEIYYENGKRKIDMKKNRPYDIEDWEYFRRFKEFFNDMNSSESKLQKIVTLIYSKLFDWDDKSSIKIFMLSSFVNVLELKNSKKDEFAKIFGVKSWMELENLPEDEFIDKLYMFVDMFEFWHKILNNKKGV